MNFDILFRVVALAALFMAGYNIGWSRGWKRCDAVNNEILRAISRVLQDAIDKHENGFTADDLVKKGDKNEQS